MNNDSEKNPLMNDSFDNFLRSHLQQEKHYLDDNNFTAQVMVNLPGVKTITRWQERLIIIVPLLVISALVLSQQSLLAFVIRCWVLLSVSSVDSLLQIMMEASIVVLLGASYWFAKQCRWL